MSMPLRTRTLVLGAAVALLAACGSDGDDTAASPATTASTMTATGDGDGAGGTAEIPAALDFEAPLVGGGELDARRFAGETVVFWFWSPY